MEQAVGRAAEAVVVWAREGIEACMNRYNGIRTVARSEVLARNVYEAMFILDSNRFGRDPDGISGQLTDMIQKLGGEILVSRLWEERRLAYPIKGQRKGTYWLIYLSLDRRTVDGLATPVRDHRNDLAVPVPEDRSADRRCLGRPRPVGAGAAVAGGRSAGPARGRRGDRDESKCRTCDEVE